MTTAAHDVLKAFEALSPAEQQQVAAELLRRSADAGELSEVGLEELADELFRGYDAEEAARGQP